MLYQMSLSKKEGAYIFRSLYIFRNNKTYLAKEKDKIVENVRKCYCFYFLMVETVFKKKPQPFF